MPSKKVLAREEEDRRMICPNEFKQAQSMVFADYRGLTVEQDTAMRAALRKAGVKYQVVKNTLSGRALESMPAFPVLDDMLKGPTAIAYSKQDVIGSGQSGQGICRQVRQADDQRRRPRRQGDFCR